VLNTATHSSRPPPARAIGLLGGSFDPVHRGHLQLARDARDQLGLAEVRWLPAGQPWQKTGLTPAGHRLAMVRLALQDESRMSVDAREIERDGPSYTIDTLRELRLALGPQVPLVLLIGSDQLERLDTWRAWDELLNHAHLAVARRNHAVLVLNDRLHAWFNTHWAPAAQVHAAAAGCVTEFAMTPVDASATEARRLLAQPPSAARDERLAAVVPAAVLDYIDRHRLYR